MGNLDNEDIAVEIRPPNYNDGEPPAYDSMVGKVKKAREESTGTFQFVWAAFSIIFCGTICCGLYIVVMLAIPIASIVMGAIYLHDCPRERFIPIYLVVAGCFGALKALMNMGEQIHGRLKRQDEDVVDQKKKPNPIDSVISCFLFAWFIAGSVWVYRVYGDYQSVDPEVEAYCHRTLYLFSFWIITVQYILLALSIIICCIGIGLACICS